MLKCVFKFSRSDWGLRIHVPNKFSDKTLVQKGKGVVERAFTLELRSPDCNSTSVVPVSENLRDPTPSFPCYTTHSHNTIICLGPTGTDLIMFFILFHVRTPLDSQAAFQLPQLEVWELACLASEPVLSPLPIPSQVRKSVSFVLQDFVNCQQNLQCSFSINWKLSSPCCFKKNLCLHWGNCFPCSLLSGVYFVSHRNREYVLLAPYCYSQTSFQSFLISKNHPFWISVIGLCCPWFLIVLVTKMPRIPFISPTQASHPLPWPLPRPCCYYQPLLLFSVNHMHPAFCHHLFSFYLILSVFCPHNSPISLALLRHWPYHLLSVPHIFDVLIPLLTLFKLHSQWLLTPLPLYLISYLLLLLLCNTRVHLNPNFCLVHAFLHAAKIINQGGWSFFKTWSKTSNVPTICTICL